MRVGTGYDLHLLEQGRPLILGSVRIEHEKGLVGHSDADVLCHAITDAILGAAAMGDIGRHFPDTDPQYAGADSLKLLEQAWALVQEAGYSIGNVDSTIVAQRPKLAPHIDGMRENLARALDVPITAISVKAKTNEGLGSEGREEAISAQAIVLLNANG